MTDEDDEFWPMFPVILGAGSMHELNGVDQPRRSRLWDLKSTSKAACEAYDRVPATPARRVGFWLAPVTADLSSNAK